IVAAELHGLGLDYVENYPMKVGAVTIDDARAAAAKHVNPEDVVIVLVGKADVVAPQLEKVGVHAERISYTDPISAEARAKAHAARSAITQASPAELGKAKALIDRALQAVGGADKLKAIKDVVVTAKMTLPMGKAS